MEEESKTNKRRRLNADEDPSEENQATESDEDARAAVSEQNDGEESESNVTGAGASAELARVLQQRGVIPRNVDLSTLGNLQRDPAALQELAGRAAVSTDPLVAHLRQNLLNEQLQQARVHDRENPTMHRMNMLRGPPHPGIGLSGLPPMLGSAATSQLAAAILLQQARQNQQQQQQQQIRQQQRRQSPPSIRHSRRQSNDPPAAYDEETEGGPYYEEVDFEERKNQFSQQGGSGASSNEDAIRQLLSLSAPETYSGAGPPPSRLLAGLGAPGPAGLSNQLLGNQAMLHSLLAQRGLPPALHHLGRQGLGQFPGFGGREGGYPVTPFNPAFAGAAASTSRGPETPRSSRPQGTSHQPIHLYMSCDDDDLSPYQCLVRKQIELFEALEEDAESNARGRNRPIVVGQVGIRCKHCKMLPPRKRERAAIYYPSKLDRLYQAGQTMASVHLGQHCQHIPKHIRTELARLREGKSAALAGKKYWSDGARALGIYEDDERLFFQTR